MTINEMHIGIDLGLRRTNSNVFNKLEREEKDYILNVTIGDIIRISLLGERNTSYSLETYSDIRKYYEVLYPLIRERSLGFTNYPSEGYVEAWLPISATMGAITSGFLHNDADYKVLIAGTTNLSTYGYIATPVVGETFRCDIDNYKSATTTTLNHVKGERVIVVSPGSQDFTTLGARTRNAGEEFVFNATAALDLTLDANVELKYITKQPTWVGTTLIATSNPGYYLNSETKSLIACGDPISSGALTKDTMYKVVTAGTTDLSTYGNYVTPIDSTIFTSLLGTAPIWIGGTVLKTVKKYGNRLVKSQDVNSFLTHAYGTTATSPISIMTDDKVRIYHDNKFTIDGAYLQYVEIPISVDWNNSISCNLPLSVHSKIVDWTVERIAAQNASENYQHLTQENMKREQQIQ